ncbi:hypothetical protein EIP91_003795 [Steccherinum ochraceum]|uniref:Uncharacterized protein n=1 Tax=Steccherinum ochraceum TaxID=92696 RepID=A0A4R0R9Y3_9APHY|nr:hypothetical protein EIP91_003795 [Steccherinum ochraceum]
MLARDDASGALNFGKIISGILRREDLDLSARDNSGAVALVKGPLGHEPVVLNRPAVARDDASGAFNVGKVITGILKREDIEDLIARDDASGALNFGKIISGILKREDFALPARDNAFVFPSGMRPFPKNVPQPHATRDDAGDSGAFNIGKVISGILKRDGQPFAREFVFIYPSIYKYDMTADNVRRPQSVAVTVPHSLNDLD